MRYCIGIDLGGTNIAGGIADLDGKLLLTDSIKTGLPCPASDIADRIALLCRRMATALGLALSDAASAPCCMPTIWNLTTFRWAR